MRTCAPSHSPSRRAARCRWGIGSLHACWVVLGCAVAANGDPPAFDQYAVATTASKQETVFTGFLLGGALADIAVLHTDGSGERRLQIHAFDGDGAWAQALDATLRADVAFADVARIGGRDRLVIVNSEGIHWFDPDALVERPLAPIRTHHLRAVEGEVAAVDITRDVNGDGLDDLVVPHLDGFQIAVQRQDGSFAAPVLLGPPEPFRDQTAFGDSHSYGAAGLSPTTIPWYMSRVHALDYDHDGRQDLAFWNGGHFDVHRQNVKGGFDAEAQSVPAGAPFDSDGVYSLVFGFGDTSAFALMVGLRRRTTNTVLRLVRDLNGDGVADLLTHTLRGRSLIRLRSRYQAHFGARKGAATVFASQPSTAAQSKGWAGGLSPAGYSWLVVQDFDSDGDSDMMIGNVNMGVTKIIRAVAGSSITMNLEFYRMENDAYPDQPTAVHKIRPAIRPLNKDVFFAPVLLGDVNGDGHVDLIRGKSRHELAVFAGNRSGRLFARQPTTLAVTVPNNERNVYLTDMNDDGKQDILLHRRAATEQPRLTVLLAR